MRAKIHRVLDDEAKGSGMQIVFQHFKDRRAWIEGEHNDRALALLKGQSSLRTLITTQAGWGLERLGDFGNASNWLHVMTYRGKLSETQSNVSSPLLCILYY